ncbi:MAG: aminoacetone oxidase family FAD-binding enzyme [Pusillimonas sp.]|jgi:predicted Rossmann fold flavoprotein|nr:aminoacetone oxidase family FAD-binding enzyme [Pusillimonas sp.]
MMAASVAGQSGLKVVLLDHAERLAEKIRISGGGRCNFTNKGTTAANFISQNPHFCRSALAGYTAQDFIRLVDAYRILWHEKHRGQLFCDDSSESIISMLRHECDKGGVAWRMPCAVQAVSKEESIFKLDTNAGAIHAKNLVVATGGLAIPKLGATDFALKLARQFGLKVVEPRPALVPLLFDSQQWQPFSTLSGVAVQARVSTRAQAVGKSSAKPASIHFDEDLLFTHKGLSGPAILQISSYWNPGQPIVLDLAPDNEIELTLRQARQGNRQLFSSVLASVWPKRLADQWLKSTPDLPQDIEKMRLADAPNALLSHLARHIHQWTLVPSGTAGYRKAEVMRGGVDTRYLDQRSMQAKSVPGLYFVGEAVDVTGWLGGYNFQWAWSSAVACARAIKAKEGQ